MTLQAPHQPGQTPFITRQYAQRFLPTRTTEEWQASDEDYAARGYILCSMGDERFVNPNFLRVLPDGTIAALCPDRQGRHRMAIGPSAYQAFLAAYNSARPVFQRGDEVSLEAVQKVLDSGEALTMTLREAIDTGLRQIRTDRAEQAADVREDAQAQAPEATTEEKPTPIRRKPKE